MENLFKNVDLPKGWVEPREEEDSAEEKDSAGEDSAEAASESRSEGVDDGISIQVAVTLIYENSSA